MVGSRLRPIRTIALAAATSMGLLALTDWLDSPISVAVMIVASVITVRQRIGVHRHCRRRRTVLERTRARRAEQPRC
jgi:heme exporter protein D